MHAIVLVCDNHDTHGTASLHGAFASEEARRLSERFEIHHTPKHGSWLDMAEIELGVLFRQCLSGRMATRDEMEGKAAGWEAERNATCVTVDWQFTTDDARVKLKRLYQKYLP